MGYCSGDIYVDQTFLDYLVDPVHGPPDGPSLILSVLIYKLKL